MLFNVLWVELSSSLAQINTFKIETLFSQTVLLCNTNKKTAVTLSYLLNYLYLPFFYKQIIHCLPILDANIIVLKVPYYIFFGPLFLILDFSRTSLHD